MLSFFLIESTQGENLHNNTSSSDSSSIASQNCGRLDRKWRDIVVIERYGVSALLKASAEGGICEVGVGDFVRDSTVGIGRDVGGYRDEVHFGDNGVVASDGPVHFVGGVLGEEAAY